MKKVEVYLVVEGHTEQTFARNVLAPEMATKGIYLYPALLGEPGRKGGNIQYERAQKDIGIPEIRACCPHFNQWLIRLEQLSGRE